ncbi:MAG: sugar nucleotide-binding protein, partial [Candidatus Parcubacteria bacterium]|nr:sugar nucleotide-binding protein [Candidatus Parcubacteria bacterium]
FSTDYVFPGHKKGGYQEKDRPTEPINFYGLSKLGGEKEILKLKNRGLRYYLIRTAWLFGPKSRPHWHKNFVDTILRLAKIKNEIKVVNDQWGCPTYSHDLAQAVKAMVEEKTSSGVYHITNSGAITWYKFAKSIISFSKNKLKVYPCGTKDYPSPAKRPQYSILLNTKLPRLRSWPGALRDYLKS